MPDLSKANNLKLILQAQKDIVAQQKRLETVFKSMPGFKTELKQAASRGLSDKSVKVKFKKRVKTILEASK